MGWPQDGTWAALEDGARLRVDGGTWRLGVDAGTACLVDDEATARGMPDPAEVDWHWELFERDWFKRMDDPDHLRDGLANITLPLARDGENIVLIHSGWGDGYYPLVGGYDADGGLVAVHIDFGVVDPDAERLAGGV